jgi:hypothetical protein
MRRSRSLRLCGSSPRLVHQQEARLVQERTSKLDAAAVAA